MKKNIIILGIQWGDEGKGKIIDFLSKKAKYIVRCQGGENAGHTIFLKRKKIILHLIPSGIFQENTINIISNGVVLSLKKFVQEINELEKIGISVRNKILISKLCTLVLPYHVLMDILREEKKNKVIIGTTRRGIGPAYEDKVARRAIRIIDVFNEKILSNKLEEILDYYNFQFTHYYHAKPIEHKKVLDEILSVVNILKNFLVDVQKVLWKARKKSETIIFEGAQGTLLDIDHGIYPYVTSSNTTIGGIISGSGIYVEKCKILGVMKSYSTRVGLGPFPTEIFSKTSEKIRSLGKEFGSTTGRIRRIGWIDTVMIRYAIRINSCSEVCLTKLDVLDNLSEIKICVAYILKGEYIKDIYSIVEKDCKSITPIYKTVSGWKKNTTGIKSLIELPKFAIEYIKILEKIIEIPISMISTGPNKEDIIIL